MSVTDVSSLSQRGAQVEAPENPESAVMENMPDGSAGTDYVVRFTAPEFISLCPMRGQSDFAHIVIDYIPGDFLVESNQHPALSGCRIKVWRPIAVVADLWMKAQTKELLSPESKSKSLLLLSS